MQSIIKHDRVSLEEAAGVPSALPARTPGSAGGGKSGTRCKKGVELLRENGVVHAIEVRCSCGETTLIELEYAPERGAGA
ncbi:MAG: hypothetical protein IPK67_15820 [Planctomycetes bacterium]|nr:hypothetical protein [Planctomycetota bacterium]